VSTDGTLEISGDTSTLRFERRLAHPVERVWSALTDPDEIEAWLAHAELDLVQGGRVELRWLNTDEDGNTAIARGTVSQLDPPRLLELDTDIHGVLRWELEPDGNATELTFTVVNAMPEEYRTKVIAGWHVHLDFLEDWLTGERVDWPNWPKDRWDAIHDRYVATLA